MGKKLERMQSFSSSSGRTDRKYGMYSLESRARKFWICMCFAVSCIVFVIFGGLHGWRANNANMINADYWVIKDKVSPYDSCIFPGSIRDPDVDPVTAAEIQLRAFEYCADNQSDCAENGTRWSVAFNFNTVIMIFSAVNFILMAIGGYWFYPRLFGTFINCCYACCHCAAWTMAVGVYASPLGQLCTLNVHPNDYEGDGKWTYTEDPSAEHWTYKKDG